jgi:RNA polymerase sigma-70 factor (ECF subfamily)
VLLARLCAGDDRALAVVYDEHAAVVFATARRVTVNEQLARDVTQDVFVGLWEAPDRVDLARGPLRAYLRTVAHRRAVDAVRRSERRARAESVATTTPASAASIDRIDGPEDAVADADAASWCGQRIADALAVIPHEQREVLRLVYIEGRTMREVAVLLSIPEGTVKSRARLGLARVRAEVADELRAGR